jgi:hypothetical protein
LCSVLIAKDIKNFQNCMKIYTILIVKICWVCNDQSVFAF